MNSTPEPLDPQALVYAEEVRELYRRERARADELQRAKDELEATNARLRAEVAERELAEQALRQAQKMEAIGQLAGGIAHDFNNLLSVIINYAGFLEEELADRSDLIEDVREIRDAGQRAAELTRQLLMFSRKEIVQPRVIDICEVVSGLEKILRRTIRENVRLEISCPDHTGPVKIDPGQLEQVVLNLVVNARDAMSAGGLLTIEVQDRVVDDTEVEEHPGLVADDYVALVVEDTGTGMEPEVVTRIFEPFFTTKERGVGTGLGLATVYGIIKGAGGYVLCESEPGAGTRFTVFLPRTLDDVEAPPAGRSDVPQRSRRGKILVVDDEEGIRRVLERLLSMRGYRVITADAGDEGVRALQENPDVDAVVTDLIMPGLSGLSLLSALRSARPLVPIVLMSGYSEDMLARNGGIDADIPLVPKPVVPEHLFAALESVLAAGSV